MDTQACATSQDWHPADIKAALEKKGVSLRSLAREYGYSHFARVLTSRWWAAEQIVAKTLGIKPQTIWPSRYQLPRDRDQRMTRNAVALELMKKPVKRRAKAGAIAE